MRLEMGEAAARWASGRWGGGVGRRGGSDQGVVSAQGGAAPPPAVLREPGENWRTAQDWSFCVSGSSALGHGRPS